MRGKCCRMWVFDSNHIKNHLIRKNELLQGHKEVTTIHVRNLMFFFSRGLLGNRKWIYIGS